MDTCGLPRPRGWWRWTRRTFPVNTVPPPVALERFAVDDVAQALHAADSSVVIPAGHVHFQFDYAGLSFTAPQKVRYRYMLEGFDRGWTEAGARRTAYYTNIPPGRYTFRVQAANNDGLWNTEGAALTFELRPHFYQTLWFYALLLAGCWRAWLCCCCGCGCARAEARVPRRAGRAQPHCARDSRHAGAGLRGHLRAVGGAGGVAAQEQDRRPRPSNWT